MNRVKLKSQALAEAGMWPSNDPGKVNPQPWLKNFDESEDVTAAALIDIFVYFSDQQVSQVLERALRRLLQTFGGTEQSLDARRDRILNRLETTLFVPVEGETPNPTDSGNYMCRRARQTLELSDSQVRQPASALQEYLNHGKTIVFLDDMVGTGSQMRGTWTREYASRHPKSFREAYRQTKRECYYVCLACSKEGGRSLAAVNGIELISAHDLQERDRFEEALLRIPDHPSGSGLQADVEALLRKYAATLRLEDYMRRDKCALFGFGQLGLTLGFQHSMPDATLPIYWADSGGNWKTFSKRK
ncbi:MAG: hypothetical protein OXC69_06295 [Candidatus Tectomicrobia bacterium]|nr:hypothetical protein [Candidatus Tectomicrobia bacterium]